jgi:hypothetical protein
MLKSSHSLFVNNLGCYDEKNDQLLENPGKQRHQEIGETRSYYGQASFGLSYSEVSKHRRPMFVLSACRPAHEMYLRVSAIQRLGGEHPSYTVGSFHDLVIRSHDRNIMQGESERTPNNYSFPRQ